MAFVDELTFEAHAGNGGNGVVRWRREKYIPKGGPYGGDGGRGGNVVVVAVRNLSMLAKHARRPVFKAEHGEDGGSAHRHGGNGEDINIELPIGSVITNLETGKTCELLHDGERIILLRGGEGGYGNAHFKSPEETTPQRATPGAPGEQGTFAIELRLIADAGFVGLPNAGKSSLLNELTRAGARVGAYPFTTLDPNLGDFHGYVLADIPGLIEGASAGRGLGHKFLRHLARTRFLIHCISLEEPDTIASYDTVRREVVTYGDLAQKPECIVLTKADTVTDDDREDAIRRMRAHTGIEPVAVSVLDDALLESFQKKLSAWLSAGSGEVARTP